MPLLGGLIVSLFGGFATYLGAWFTAKVAAATAALATFLVINLAVVAAFVALVSTISVAWPGGIPTSFIWVMLPDNALLCISVMTGVDAAVLLYRWNTGALTLAATAT